ncbi:Zn(2)-C6 fungal-type DNA-binding domain protein [Ophiocordyceps camponoti-floridani]|uniref:Zn(2)-C6 fungal-type DNA-binding domain protein n=1 Tax=Ophiocordyceps camponoti-floridani TaxID=2030778 RepID=A0A8H4Q7D6_9HYPO|nr:Zn(2)-C6 fungal-type DNA-binding domain protein [Ophiocordyceps camponoti-floridani]
MADDQHQHHQQQQQQYQQQQHQHHQEQQQRFQPLSPESQHPPQPRAPVAPRGAMAATVLPSIHETRAATGYAPQPPPSARPYPIDARFSSPSAGPYQEYAQQAAGAPAMAQAAPRQRTSIACRYCRKRKIRCSGYQNTPGGKCQNCARMNQECIFQPVSSSSSTAFIPVSAVPGGVPPGTQLFGAYGQPLAPNAMSGPHPYPPQQHPGGPSPGLFNPPQQPPPPTQSPTGSYSSYGDETSQVAGRRRRRTPEEREEGYRLPPPRGGGGGGGGGGGSIGGGSGEDEARRRSPAELSGDSSPGGAAHGPYQSSRQSPRAPMASAPNGSSGGSTPGRQQSGQPSSVMSLSNLVEKNDIDRTMIDRLNHARDKGTNGSR